MLFQYTMYLYITMLQEKEKKKRAIEQLLIIHMMH
jgi:hypothetical protein